MSYLSVLFCFFIIGQSNAKSDDYDINLYSENYDRICPFNGIVQPQPFTSKSDVVEWVSQFKMCQTGWFNEETNGNTSFIDIMFNVSNSETKSCFYDKSSDKKGTDTDNCYLWSSLSYYFGLMKDLCDVTETNINIDEWDNKSFTISGQVSGVLDITGIEGFGKGPFKKNKFEEKYTFIFNENNNGIISKVEAFDNGALRKKVLKYTSKLSYSFSSINHKMDYLIDQIHAFNANNGYIQIDPNIAYSLIILFILITILLIFCTFTQWICCRNDNKHKSHKYQTVSFQSSSEPDAENIRLK